MKYTFSNFLGSSPAAMEVKRQARRAAQADTTVLLLGETGTGKEVLAQAIHAASPRAHGPFIGVNVAAIPDTLLEAEFFGASPSAYTGADRRGRDGKFVLANGGTLFLDEVGDMPMGDAGEAAARAAGKGSRAARIEPRDQGGRARDRGLERGPAPDGVDGPLPLRPLLPPLGAADRAAAAARSHRRPGAARATTSSRTSRARAGRPQRELTPTALAVLSAYAWPGNIRELRNVLEQVTLNSDNPRLSAEEFTPRAAARGAGAARRGDRPTLKLADVVADAERDAIRSALAAAEGKKILAAELLGISRATLYQKLSVARARRAGRPRAIERALLSGIPDTVPDSRTHPTERRPRRPRFGFRLRDLAPASRVARALRVASVAAWLRPQQRSHPGEETHVVPLHARARCSSLAVAARGVQQQRRRQRPPATRTSVPDFVKGTIVQNTYDGTTNDLLTAGLGKTGLRGRAARRSPIPANPTVAELRRQAIYNNYRALVDITANGGYGTLYGPNVDAGGVVDAPARASIAGDEHIAYADDGTGRQNVTLMVQIPSTFSHAERLHRHRGLERLARRLRRDRHRRRMGPEARLRRGLHRQGHGQRRPRPRRQHGLRASQGARADAATRGHRSRIFTAHGHAMRSARRSTPPFPNRWAYKHAHSQQNPEKDWGRDTLQAVAVRLLRAQREVRPARQRRAPGDHHAATTRS